MIRIKKVLARKDAYSVMLGITLALSAQSVLYITYSWATELLAVPGTSEFASYAPTGQPWQLAYGQPILNFVLQVALIEAFLWLVFGLGQVSKNMKPLGSSRKK